MCPDICPCAAPHVRFYRHDPDQRFSTTGKSVRTRSIEVTRVASSGFRGQAAVEESIDERWPTCVKLRLLGTIVPLDLSGGGGGRVGDRRGDGGEDVQTFGFLPLCSAARRGPPRRRWRNCSNVWGFAVVARGASGTAAATEGRGDGASSEDLGGSSGDLAQKRQSEGPLTDERTAATGCKSIAPRREPTEPADRLSLAQDRPVSC